MMTQPQMFDTGHEAVRTFKIFLFCFDLITSVPWLFCLAIRKYYIVLIQQEPMVKETFNFKEILEV